MKAPGSIENDYEARAEALLLAAPELVDPEKCTYRPAVAPVASPSYHAVESVSFDVAPDGGKATLFLRIGVDEMSELVDPAVALAAARRFGDHDLSPKVLRAEAETNVILFERLAEPWRAAKIDDLMLPDMAVRLVGIQKAVAAGEPFGRAWSVFDGIDRLACLAQRDGAPLPDDFDWMLAWMDIMRAAITASGVDFRPAHGDPHSSDVMIGPERAMRLVDFDMAGDMDPYYSLGVLMNELYQFEAQMKLLLEAHDGSAGLKAFSRCRLYAAADDLYWALRSLILEMRSPRRSVEFLKYAGWRFLRCRMQLGHPDFEGKLRTL